MPASSQTNAFPEFRQVIREFSQNLTAIAQVTNLPGVLAGMDIGIPNNGTAAIVGLMPTMSAGVLIDGDAILEISPINMIAAAPNTAVNMYWGADGFRYVATPPSPKHTLLGRISTDTDGVRYVAQPTSQGSCQIGLKAQVNLGKAATGAPVTMLSIDIPKSRLFKGIVIEHALTRVLFAGTGAGGNFILRSNGADLVTVATAAQEAAGTLGYAGNPTRRNATLTGEIPFDISYSLAAAKPGCVMEVSLLARLFS